MTLLFLIIASVCWGSFLNVVAYRLVKGQSLFVPFSSCPNCGTLIAWYDTVPILSWIVLRGKCRQCQTAISWLYPFIELLAGLLFPLLWYRVSMHHFPAYALLFSALLVTIRTDLEHLLISRFVTLFLVPVGLAFSLFGLLPLTPVESMGGALFGYGLLFIVAQLFFYCTGKEGMGQGDFDLLACIGSFIGPFGVWITLLIGSTVGSIVGLFFILMLKKDPSFKLPFGPFLAAGAISFVLFNHRIYTLLNLSGM